MKEKRQRIGSQLFTLRLWLEEVEDGRTEFRGTLKHVLTGETRHFRSWPTLIQCLKAFYIDEQNLDTLT